MVQAGSTPARRFPRRGSHQVTAGHMMSHAVTLGHKSGVAVGGLGVQLEFDWSRRERCAQRNLESLSLVGVSPVQNAVVFLMQMHPAARLLEAERKVTALRISQAAGARWLKLNCPSVKHLGLDRSVFRRAVLDWSDRGVAMFAGGQIVMSFGALLEWHEARQLADEELLSAWERVTERDRVGPGVTERDPLNEGEKNSKKSLSFNPSEIFAKLPAEVWEPKLLPDSRLYETLRAWWEEDGQRHGVEVDHAVGAILAARTGKTNALRYAETCLSRGVDPSWVARAHNWRLREKQKPQPQFTAEGARLDSTAGR